MSVYKIQICTLQVNIPVLTTLDRPKVKWKTLLGYFDLWFPISANSIIIFIFPGHLSDKLKWIVYINLNIKNSYKADVTQMYRGLFVFWGQNIYVVHKSTHVPLSTASLLAFSTCSRHPHAGGNSSVLTV